MTDLVVFESYTALSVYGELDFAVEQEVKDAWMEALAGRPRALLLDLTAVPLLDSSGVRVLLAGCQRTQDRGGVVAVLLGPDSHVGRVLELIGLSRVLPLFHDRTAALHYLWLASSGQEGEVPESSGDRLATNLSA